MVYIRDGELQLMCLFMSVLGHIDVLIDARCITVVEHLGGEVCNVDHVDPAATQLEMIHYYLGGYSVIYGLGMLELADPCIFGGVDDEGVAAVFGRFLKI